MNILQIENLHKKYSDFEAIRGIDISIEKGEIYGLLGPNGAGKSTLIKTISGLEKATSGKIIFEEKEANINKAEGERQAAILRAEGEAKARIQVAQAEAEAIKLVSDAIAQHGDPEKYLIAIRYIDTLKSITSGENNKVVYMPYEATGVLSSLDGIKQMLNSTK